MSKTAINQPPIKTPMQLPNGALHPVWSGWFAAMHRRVGAEIGAVAIEHGGTGATSASEARLVLGIPINAGDVGAAPQGSDVDSDGNVTGTHLAAPLPVAQGGTGLDTLATLLAALGVKYQRIALTQTPSAVDGASADTAFTWTQAYADSNYTVVVLLEASGTYTNAKASLSILSKVAAGFTIRMTNVAAVQNSGVAHVIGIHD
jgi:hypothetical protein